QRRESEPESGDRQQPTEDDADRAVRQGAPDHIAADRRDTEHDRAADDPADARERGGAAHRQRERDEFGTTAPPADDQPGGNGPERVTPLARLDRLAPPNSAARSSKQTEEHEQPL